MPNTNRTGIRTVINPQCCRNFARSCAMYIPIDWLGRYVLVNIDTISKLLDHVLILMAVCNFFCMISARKIASLSAFATFLLGFQNAILLWVLKGNRQQQQQQQASLFLPPNEFMIGVCLGITIGGTILSFFLCLMYGKSHEFCEEVIHMTNTANNNNNNNATDDDSSSSSSSSTYVDLCRTWKGAIDGVWWWSSCVFWLNLLTCILIAAGRHEIANNNNSGMNNAQYETIMDNNNIDDNDNNNMTGGMNPNNEDQYQEQYNPSQQQQQSQSQQGSYSGNYNNVPDINHPGQPVQQQQQQQQQQFVDSQQQQYQQQYQQQSMMSHQNPVPRHHQQEDPLLV